MTRFISIIGTLAIACMLLVGMAPAPAVAQVSVGVGLSVSFGPPAIPYYVQPPAPGSNYIWQPGYWAYDPVDGYYWVPGTWVPAPAVGVYWTPGYWGYNNGMYGWNAGYWGPVVGFYGGINYGFGYYGNGYVGGRWDNGYFRYNTAINNINVEVVHNYVYSDRAVYRPWHGSVAYNGGPRGIQARPTEYDRRAYSERRYGMTPVQIQHATYAKQDPIYRYNTNHGQVPRNRCCRAASVYVAARTSRVSSCRYHPQRNHAAQCGSGRASCGSGTATRGSGAATRGSGAAVPCSGAATRSSGAAVPCSGAATRSSGAATRRACAAASTTNRVRKLRLSTRISRKHIRSRHMRSRKLAHNHRRTRNSSRTRLQSRRAAR